MNRFSHKLKEIWSEVKAVHIIICIFLSWITLPLFMPFGLFVFIWVIILFVLLMVRRSFQKAMILLFGSSYIVVPVFYVILGTISYFEGTAEIRFVGYPSLESRNLDRETRCYKRSSGCSVTGAEFFTHIPNNLTVRTLARIFGPMKGAYTGYYPTNEESLKMLEGKDAVNFSYPVESEEALPEPLRSIYKNDKKFRWELSHCFRKGDPNYTWNVNANNWEIVEVADRITLRFIEIDPHALLFGNIFMRILYDVEKGRTIARYHGDYRNLPQ